jgi:hypothetical protein
MASTASEFSTFKYDIDHPEFYNSWQTSINTALAARGLKIFIQQPVAKTHDDIVVDKYQDKHNDAKAIQYQLLLEKNIVRDKDTNEVKQRSCYFDEGKFLLKKAEAVNEINKTLQQSTQSKFSKEIDEGDPFKLYEAIKAKSVNLSMQTKQNILDKLDAIKLETQTPNGFRKLFHDMRQVYNQLELIDKSEASEEKQINTAFKKLSKQRHALIHGKIASLQGDYERVKRQEEAANGNADLLKAIVPFTMIYLENGIISAANLVEKEETPANFLKTNGFKKFNKGRRPSFGGQGNGSVICRQFAKHGNCKFGDSCKYKHEKRENHSSKPKSNGNSSPSGSKKPRPCRYFANGSCRAGSDCSFSHDTGRGRHINAKASFKTKKEVSEHALTLAPASANQVDYSTLFDSGCGEHYASRAEAIPSSIKELVEPVTVNGFNNSSSSTITHVGSIRRQDDRGQSMIIDNVLLSNDARHTLLSSAKLADDGLFSIVLDDQMLVVESARANKKRLKRKLMSLMEDDDVRVVFKVPRNDSNVYAAIKLEPDDEVNAMMTLERKGKREQKPLSREELERKYDDGEMEESRSASSSSSRSPRVSVNHDDMEDGWDVEESWHGAAGGRHPTPKNGRDD